MASAYTLEEFNLIVESENFKEQYGEFDFNIEDLKLPGEDKYVLPALETQLGIYKVDKIQRLSEDVVKENLLIFPYRVHGTLIKPSEVYENYPQMLKQLSKTCNIAIDNIPDYNALINYYDRELNGVDR